MRPVRLQPHALFLPRPGARSIRYSQVAGYYLRPAGAEYVVGIRPAPVEEPVTDTQVADFRQRWGATCSERIARILTGLERDWRTR